MIKAKLITLKPYRVAISKLVATIQNGIKGEGVIGVYWNFLEKLVFGILKEGVANMRFNSRDMLIIDISTKVGPNMQVLVEGSPSILGIWMDRKRRQKVLGSRRGKYYLTGLNK